MIVGPIGNSREGWLWSDGGAGVEVRFGGRGVAVADLIPSRIALARCQQEHSATVLTAQPGDCGVGDALVTDQPDLALAVVTADCVPILLAAGDRIAAVHAGWRGVAGKIVAAAVETLRDEATPDDEIIAWVGPAIGSCCYEVGEEVAESVVAVSHQAVRHEGPRGRPHIDLPLAVLQQLAAVQVRRVRLVPACTRCEEELLWSYRREGPQKAGGGAGRNQAVIWRSNPDSDRALAGR